MLLKANGTGINAPPGLKGFSVGDLQYMGGGGYLWLLRR
jgi:hypothetical protein